MKRVLALLLAVLLLMPQVCGAATKYVEYKGVSYAKNAEYINIKNGVRKEEMNSFLAFLKKMPNLKKVDMFAVPIGRERREQLQAAFPDIEFGMTMIIGGHHKVRTDATVFSTLHSDDDIYHGSDDFSALKYCRNLRALDLGHNKITDLSFLYDLPKLRVLILAKNKITDITPIASLYDLEYLEVFQNYVEDLTPLTGLTHLTDLNITGNRVGSLKPLKKIRSLRRLWIANADKADPGKSKDKKLLASLQEALPKAEIDGVSAGTSGTWRKHARYKTIQKMFRSGEYSPFSDVKFKDYAYKWPEKKTKNRKSK